MQLNEFEYHFACLVWYSSLKNHYTDRIFVDFLTIILCHHCIKLFKVVPAHSDEVFESHFVTDFQIRH